MDHRLNTLDKKNIADILSLTPLQEGFLYHYLRDPSGTNYFEQLSLTISGPIQLHLFQNAWNILIQSNEMLRALFRWDKINEPVQIILKEYSFKPLFIDLSSYSPHEQQQQLQQIKQNDTQQPFDLQQIPFRVTLCRLSPQSHIIIISNHHILYDGWSNGIILKEFLQVYEELSHSSTIPSTLPILQKTHFKTFIKYSRDILAQTPEVQQFWKTYLAQFDSPTRLPLKKPASVQHESIGETTQSAKYKLQLPNTFALLIDSFCTQNKITPASLFYTAWGILLQKYTNSEDVLFGTVVSGRPPQIPNVEEIVGLFINTLPLRLNTTQAHPCTILQLLNLIHNQASQRDPYQVTPLYSIQDYLPHISNEALFDSIIAVENYPLDSRYLMKGASLSVQNYSFVESTHYDLTLNILLFSQLEILFGYHTHTFDPSTIEQIAQHFANILQFLIQAPHTNILQIPIISQQEKECILYQFNNIPTQYPQEKTIHLLFEEQVQRTPHQIALTGPSLQSSTPVQLTYHQVDRQAQSVALFLQQQGIQPQTIIGIQMERSVDIVIGILGILKAGGAYMPIDPQYPAERIQYMLKDSNTPLVIDSLIQLNKSFSGGQGAVFQKSPLENSHNLCYVIYTSGTTGKPKGSLIEHRNVVRLLFNDRFQFQFDHNDIWTLFHSFCFDFSVWEMYGALLYGGKLIIIPRSTAIETPSFLNILQKEHVTVLNQTPSAFYRLMETLENQANQTLQFQTPTLSLRYIIFGGEALHPLRLKPWKEKYPSTKLINMYGITETTVHVTFKEIDDPEIRDGSSNIGKPIPTLDVYIVDKGMNLLPIGITGEMIVSGLGVARGYLNNPELTYERFFTFQGLVLRNPPLDPDKTSDIDKLLEEPKNSELTKSFKGVQGGVVHKAPLHQNINHQTQDYKTGDLARFLPNGEIVYVGRSDHQVKIRGFRIELKEIEVRLLKIPYVDTVFVAPLKNEAGESYLCAYVKAKENYPLTSSQLRETLTQQLPYYMVPSYFIIIDQFPLTPTGKIDMKKLPLPGVERPQLETTYTQAVDQLDIQIVQIWKEILQLDKVGINDNFFDLGGNSIKVVRLGTKLKELLKEDVPVVTLFEYPTISTFTSYWNQKNKQIPTVQDTPQPFIQENPPVTSVEDKIKSGRDRMKDRRERVK